MCLAELSSSPSFDVPIVDEATYDAMARDLVAGRGLDARFFWQGLFYPLFLAAVYAFTHGSILLARVTQLLIGAMAAAGTSVLAREAAGAAVGLAAGLVVALYGPLPFFEQELVGTAWEVFWAVALALLATRARKAMRTGPAAGWLGALGVAGGLAIVTRALFVPYVLALAAWLGFAVARSARGRAAGLGALAAGLACALVPAAIAAHAATGEARILPYSGGINLYIGNGPDSDANVRIRPGAEWDRLAAMPAAHGALTPGDKEAYFVALVLDRARHDPLGVLADLGKKALELIGSREIPRNLDVYSYRAYSNLLSLSTWRLAQFGFPFGVLFPLALVGIALASRDIPIAVRIWLSVYSLAVIAVFVTGRYRAPLVPALAITAALGARASWRALSARNWPSAARIGALLAAGAAISTLPGPFAAERGDYGAEMLTFVAIEDLGHDRLDLAEPLLRNALASDPTDRVAHCVLGTVLTRRGDLDAAEAQFEAALAADPDDGSAHRGLGNVLVLQGAPARALPHFLAAASAMPDDARLLNDAGQLLHLLGDDTRAAVYLRRAVAADPTLSVARSNLEAALHGRGDP